MMRPEAYPSESDRPSLEALVESGIVELESLHPGGLALTERLAELCGIGSGTRVLDVACGTGESACHLAEKLGAQVCGLDQSAELLARARAKADARGLAIEFRHGDAAALPFHDAAFDVAICECTLCLLDKDAVLGEMARVVRADGRVGMHDLYWTEDAPAALRGRLVEYESEYPETLAGWQRLFTEVGLIDVQTVDASDTKQHWMRDMRRQLGISGYLALGRHALGRWGVSGVWRMLMSERVFSDEHLGYALLVGHVPGSR